MCIGNLRDFGLSGWFVGVCAGRRVAILSWFKVYAGSFGAFVFGAYRFWGFEVWCCGCQLEHFLAFRVGL